MRLPHDVGELEELVRETRRDSLIIDPIVAAIDTELDAHKDQHVRSVLARLADSPRARVRGRDRRPPEQDAEHGRLHPGRQLGRVLERLPLGRPRHRGRDEPDLRLIAQRKANYARLRPVERHRIEEVVLPDTLDAVTGEPIVTSRMVFVEIADDVEGADVLGPRKTTKTETAETLLEALLADGDWHESNGLRTLLQAAGYNARLAQRAAKALRVEHDRRGFPASTWWRLPVATTPVATNAFPQNVATVDAACRSGSVP